MSASTATPISKYATVLRERTRSYIPTYDENTKRYVTTTYTNELIPYNNRIYGTNPKNIEIKQKKNIDYVYYHNKTMKAVNKTRHIKNGNVGGHGYTRRIIVLRIKTVKYVFHAYKLINDHFDIIVNCENPGKENMLSIMYTKIDEHITSLKVLQSHMILASKEKLYRNFLKQLYKYYSKYQDYHEKRLQHAKDMLQVIKIQHHIPNEIIKREIMEYLGI